MAVGMSGSNGGITCRQRRIGRAEIELAARERFLWKPLEISYFANNLCNLRCRHCYVGYERSGDGLAVEEWFDVFEQCLALGALTFGNVGKEPTLCWDKTIALLRWLADRRRLVPALRLGLVTNATRLGERKAADLLEVAPDYLDVSLDGVAETHEAIRGHGTYQQTIRNIAALPQALLAKVFISFTANQGNIDAIPAMAREVYRLGVRNILISPYVSTKAARVSDKDTLLATDHQLVRMCLDLIEGRLVDFREFSGLSLYVKNDYTTSLPLMNALVAAGILDFENLWIDDYDVIFTPYTFGTNRVFFNYLPFDTTFRKAVRFSHDGFVGNCLDMFFQDYPRRALGSIREVRLAELYQQLEANFLESSGLRSGAVATPSR